LSTYSITVDGFLYGDERRGRGSFETIESAWTHLCETAISLHSPEGRRSPPASYVDSTPGKVQTQDGEQKELKAYTRWYSHPSRTPEHREILP